MPVLIYEGTGRKMDPTPTGRTLDGIVADLEAYGAASIELQPGDATWYRFVLVDYRFHGYEGVRQGYGILPYSGLTMTLRTGEAYIHPDLSLVYEHDLEFISNEWSRTFIAWWLRETLAPALTPPLANPNAVEEIVS